MYRKILVALENSPGDKVLVAHIADLARQMGSSLLLLHVAEGFAARHFDELKLVESDEMKMDRAYLEQIRTELNASGLKAETHLARGNPPDEIIKVARTQNCDLIALRAHGHGLVGDLMRGSTISPVHHKTTVPVLIVPPG